MISWKSVWRPPKMSAPVAVTCMLFGIFIWFKTIKDIHRELMSYYQDTFTIPCYKNFVAAINEHWKTALILLCALIQCNRQQAGWRKKFIDATPIPVCNNKRIFTHKVTQWFAQRWKSTMWRFFWFKVHIIVDELWNLLSFSITPWNCDDRKVVKKMVRKITGTLMADAWYVWEKLMNELADMGVLFISWYKKNMKKLVTQSYLKFMKLRQIVETGFWMMKCWWSFVSSYARSLNGHFVRIVFNLLAYTIRRLSYNQDFLIS